MEQRVRDLIELCWGNFSQKVGQARIRINKEASMQMQFAYLLKNSAELILHLPEEFLEVELETGIQINGSVRECDIVVHFGNADAEHFLPIEMKCYRQTASSGEPRGASDIFHLDVYRDIELLENYHSQQGYLEGVQLTMTDLVRMPFPRFKRGKCWDYDISDGYRFVGPREINTVVGSSRNFRPVGLINSYNFNWTAVGNFYFLMVNPD